MTYNRNENVIYHNLFSVFVMFVDLYIISQIKYMIKKIELSFNLNFTDSVPFS